MKRVLALMMVAVSFGICGCMGPRVEVPTAHVGKVLTASGFEKGLRQPYEKGSFERRAGTRSCTR